MTCLIRIKFICVFFFFSSRRRHTRFDCDWSSDVCSSDLRKQNITLGAGAETLGNLERLEKSAVAIVLGQQGGVFSGPAYFVYKALTAVQIAEEVTRDGVPAVPVVLMAAGDHDLDAVRPAT